MIENKRKYIEKARPKVPDILKFKCDKLEWTFRKEITPNKHKNTKHGQPHKESGKGQFGFVLDVRLWKEAETESLKKEWRKENILQILQLMQKKNGNRTKCFQQRE